MKAMPGLLHGMPCCMPACQYIQLYNLPQEGVLTLRLLGMLFDCLSSFPAMETVIAPAFPRLILSTLNHLVESEVCQATCMPSVCLQHS